MVRQDEFNREMDTYLRNRRVITRVNPLNAARAYLRNLFPKEQKKEELPLDIPQEQVQAVLAQSTVKHTKPTQSTPTQANKPKVSKMGWFSKKKEEDYEMVEAAPVTTAPALDEETKEVLKITFKWLKQMDPEQIEQIKASSDFEKYKRVLDKYGLIKK